MRGAGSAPRIFYRFEQEHPIVFFRLVCFLSLLFVAGFVIPAHAHDPTAWGGLFRSRDFGASWFPADAGLFIGGALGVAVHPKDPAQLLYGTDARLLRSRNGGRDWTTVAATTMAGAVFAVGFGADGKSALASSGTRIYLSEDGTNWQDILAPAGAAPARAFVRSLAVPNRIYLAGAHGLFVSDDKGRTWTKLGDGVLPDNAIVSLLVTPGSPENIYAVVDGFIWLSSDGARNWIMRGNGLPAGRVEVISSDIKKPGRLWAAGAAQVFLSDDAGSTWTKYGKPIADAGVSVRGLAVSEDAGILLLATHRGMFRTTDRAQIWNQVESTLPVHLESGLLMRDPHDASTLYAGFSLSPYEEAWRRAEQGGSLLAQLDPVSLAGGLAFLIILTVTGVMTTRWLARRYRGVDSPRLR